MKIYTHWVFNIDGDELVKKFFATKGGEEWAANDAKEQGKQVVARHDWNVELTAKAVAEFCNEQMHLREYTEEPEESDIEDLI